MEQQILVPCCVFYITPNPLSHGLLPWGKWGKPMDMRVWSLAVIILGTVLPLGWTGVLVLLVLELELIRPLVSGRPALVRWQF